VIRTGKQIVETEDRNIKKVIQIEEQIVRAKMKILEVSEQGNEDS
jgi:hypothetical protein